MCSNIPFAINDPVNFASTSNCHIPHNWTTHSHTQFAKSLKILTTRVTWVFIEKTPWTLTNAEHQTWSVYEEGRFKNDSFSMRHTTKCYFRFPSSFEFKPQFVFKFPSTWNYQLEWVFMSVRKYWQSFVLFIGFLLEVSTDSSRV